MSNTSSIRDICLLCLVGLLAYLPGIASLPVIDRDEARYAQSVVQMVETGDYIDIRFQDEPRYKKPVGAYWAQAAAIHVTGQADDVRRGERPIWAQRLPSVAGALVAVVFTYLAGVALLGRRAALVGAGLLAVSVSLVFEAHQAKTDALLAGGSAVVLYGLAARKVWAVWLGVAAGVLVKGPVIVAVAGLAVGTLLFLPLDGEGGPTRKRWVGRGEPPTNNKAIARDEGSPLPTSLRSATFPVKGKEGIGWLLRPLPILVALAIVLPWFVAIGMKSEGAFFAEALGRDFGAKLGSAQETHGGPPGYYALTTLVMFWPGVIALPLAVAWAWRERRVAEVTLLLAWLVPMWLVLEIVPTKLPHYTLPLYPALALLCGGAVAATDIVSQPRWRRLGIVLFLPMAVIVATVAVWAALFDLDDMSGSTFTTLALLVLGLGILSAASWMMARQSAHQWLVLPVSLGIMTSVVFWAYSGRLADSVGAYVASSLHKAADGRRIVSPDFREPSLVYLAGRDTRVDLDELAVGDILFAPFMETDAAGCFGQNGYVVGLNYAKGDTLIGAIFTTDACEPGELETWRAREAARRSGSGG